MSLVRLLLMAALIATVGLALVVFGRAGPQDAPWTPLDPGAPVGAFTAMKLAALAGDGPRCRKMLDRAGVRFTALPPRHEGACGYDDGVRLAGGSATIGLAPAGPVLACPLAAALALWEWNVVQPAAVARFGTIVARIDHYGSYACRRIYHRASGAWSEHARANAIDVAGFRLADGRRITVARDWRGGGQAAGFLRDVRDGGCRIFATTLSPDYNAAHADHLHLDEAGRGGWSACR